VRRIRIFAALAALFMVGAPFNLAHGIQDGRWGAAVSGVCGLGLATTSAMQARAVTSGSAGPWWPAVAIAVLAGGFGVLSGIAPAIAGASADAMLVAAVGVGAVCAAALAWHLWPSGKENPPPAIEQQL
jgi:hypothetical protein